MGKNTDHSFLFFFRGICCLVFAYSHVKEASTGIIRTMHTQKKRQGGRRGRGGRGGKPRWNRNGAKVSAVGATKMAERRGRCRLFLLICEITLSLFLSVLFSPSFLPFYSPSFSLAIPSPRLVTLPVPPVSGFAGFVGMRERSFHPSSSTSFATRS